jgi:molybdopterin synthase catalytic subunit
MIRVQHEDFDLAIEIEALSKGRTDIGAVVNFVGLTRAEGGDVSAMTLEHYPRMTERALDSIEAEARRRWPLIDILIVHRVGRLEPGSRIVLVAVAARHRGEAFAACEFLVDWLKTKAPFWKREDGPAGERWVEARSDDESRAASWDGTGG